MPRLGWCQQRNYTMLLYFIMLFFETLLTFVILLFNVKSRSCELKSVPLAIEKVAGSLGYATGSLRNAVYQELGKVTASQMEAFGVQRRGQRYEVFDEKLFMNYLKSRGETRADSLGPQYGVKEIPDGWGLREFVKNADGMYSLISFAKRYGPDIRSNYQQLGGASRFGKDRSAMGIQRSPSNYWSIDAKPYIKYLISAGFIRPEMLE